MVGALIHCVLCGVLRALRDAVGPQEADWRASSRRAHVCCRGAANMTGPGERGPPRARVHGDLLLWPLSALWAPMWSFRRVESVSAVHAGHTAMALPASLAACLCEHHGQPHERDGHDY